MQLSDWEAPHLSVKQIQYAATDAWAPLLVMSKMLQFKEAREYVQMKTYATGKSNSSSCRKSNQDLLDEIYNYIESVTFPNAL